MQTWLLLVLSPLFPSLQPARLVGGYAGFVGSNRSKVIPIVYKKEKEDVLRTVLLMEIHDAEPSGVHLDALGLLVKAWVWGWSPFMVKNEAKVVGELVFLSSS